jgi:hypothetical protein
MMALSVNIRVIKQYFFARMLIRMDSMSLTTYNNLTPEINSSSVTNNPPARTTPS